MRDADAKNIPGPFRLQMGRVSGYADETAWSLTITDDASRILVLELNLSDAEVGRLLGCTSVTTSAPGTLHRSPLHGLVHHHASVSVPLPEGLDVFDVRERWTVEWPVIVNEWLSEGGWPDYWTPSHDERPNMHRRHKEKNGTVTYEVSLRAYLEPGVEPEMGRGR